MYRAAKTDEARRHVAVFLEAAEEAVRRGDPIAAAQSLRLALQNHDDPVVRAKLAAVEEAANERLHARHVARARVAERREQWSEAAESYEQAHALRAEAWSAERAANALRLSGGDLRRAVQLADQAVLAEPDVAAYRLTLGEVCLAAKLSKRAAAEAERALALDPANPRAQALSAATRK
jgi:tetratricopeptide (TPR) repeat protein